MIATVTGHRPQHLDRDYTLTSPLWQWLDVQIAQALLSLGVTKLISGMAVGVDMLAAERALALRIPVIPAIPFRGQERKWPAAQQARYHDLIRRAGKAVYVNEPGYAAWKLHARNVWMLERADALIAVWNGRPSGGTASTVRRAKAMDMTIHRIDPNDCPTGLTAAVHGVQRPPRDQLLPGRPGGQDPLFRL